MKAKAVSKYLRISPYKVRQILPLIIGKDVKTAENILQMTTKKAAYLVHKTMASAVANLRMHRPTIELDELWIEEARADGGPTMKRWRPRARGRADRILKRTSHITIVLTTK
jgi:large subunit ribosomal protein L22